MANVADRLAEVRARIAAAERSAGRAPGSVILVAVSKTKPVEAIEAAYAAGQRDFGENYAQELDRKARALAHLEGLRWHFIGNLQRNKAKLVAPHAVSIHTLDSIDLAAELEKRLAALGRAIDALVEVNVSGETQKHGVEASAVAALVAACANFPHLRVRGLMTVPPADDAAAAARCFADLARLGAALAPALGAAPLSSMGMSDDLELAIAAGATHVRVGSAIFGEREYPAPQGAEPSAATGERAMLPATKDP
jgi:pyridoxal phosphate enzyme (YggS family)